MTGRILLAHRPPSLPGVAGRYATATPADQHTGDLQQALSYAFDDYRPGAKPLGNTATAVGNGNLWYTVSQDLAHNRHTVRWETYTSFNMPQQILFGALVNSVTPVNTIADRKLTFVYVPEHQRIRQTVQLTSSAPTSMQAGTTW